MRPKTSQLDSDRNYRRGAVMGLTVAEAFMLVAFALLMLLALWRFEADAAQQDVETALSEAERQLKEAERDLAALREFRDIPAQQRAALIEMAEDGRLQIARALRDQGFENPAPEDIRELMRRLELLEQADLRRLVDAATVWRAEERARLLDFVALNPDEQSIADILAIIEDGATPDDIRRALALAASLDPEDLAGLDSLRDSIRERLRERLARQRLVAETTRIAIGDTVMSMGGDIDESGTITLPDAVLFVQGQAVPTETLQAFLRQACRPWFEALRGLPFNVDEVRIEGHASSEGRRGSTEDDAYFFNLDLSQRRAATVLELCLRSTGGDEVGRWARERATAVGHSSSRLIRNEDGTEDRERSRRVVFSAAVTTDDIFAGIDETVGQ